MLAVGHVHFMIKNVEYLVKLLSLFSFSFHHYSSVVLTSRTGSCWCQGASGLGSSSAAVSLTCCPITGFSTALYTSSGVMIIRYTWLWLR